MKIKLNIKKITVVVISLLLLVPAITTSIAQAAIVPSNFADSKLDLKVKSAIAIDKKSGQVLYAKNANKKLPIASISKLITIYLTLQAIKDKKISWNQKITPDETAIKVSQNPEYAGVNLKTGHSYTIRQLYQATLIQSANGAAMTLAKAVSGGQKQFVDLMRKQLKKWGISDAKIYTPSGLPNYTSGIDAYPGAAKNAENELSAADVALVADHLLSDFPEVVKTTQIAHLNFVDGKQATAMTNWNWMLNGLRSYDASYPLDGLKTGTTDAAGACFVGTVKKNGRRIITVVLGARHRDGNDPARFDETKKLLSYLFNNYQLFIFKKGTRFAGAKNVKVVNGKEKKVELVLLKDTGVWANNINSVKSVKADFSKENLAAPVNVGQKVGNFIIKDIPSIKNIDGLNMEATVNEDIQQVNVFAQFFRWVVDSFNKLFS